MSTTDIPAQTAEAVANLDDTSPIDLWPADVPTPLTDAEQRELLDKVRDLHRLAMFVQENAPKVLEAMESHPLAKMMGAGKMFGNGG